MFGNDCNWIMEMFITGFIIGFISSSILITNPMQLTLVKSQHESGPELSILAGLG
jgi:hypothetical protein